MLTLSVPHKIGCHPRGIWTASNDNLSVNFVWYLPYVVTAIKKRC